MREKKIIVSSDFRQLISESWSDNRMLQPSTVVTVDCKEEEASDDDASSWQLPLVLASLRVFSDAATGQTNTTGTTGDLG